MRSPVSRLSSALAVVALATLSLAGCSASASDSTFCQAYEDFVSLTNAPSAAQRDITAALSQSTSPTDAQALSALNAAGVTYLSEVEEYLGLLDTMIANTSDPDVADGITQIRAGAFEPLEDLANAAQDAVNLETFASDFARITGPLTETYIALEEPSRALEEYKTAHCEAPTP